MQVNSHEPFVPVDGKVEAENGDHNIFPYLLVNIGSGVSMIEVCNFLKKKL
jgi:type II pantothenate kinase